MTKGIKLVLMLEAIICFAPAAVFILIVILASPILLVRFAGSLLFFDGYGLMRSMHTLGVLIGGILGIIGITSLIFKIVEPSRRSLSPSKMKIFLFCGVIAILLVAGLAGKFRWSFVLWGFVFPLLGTAHFSIIGRKYLYNKC